VADATGKQGMAAGERRAYPGIQRMGKSQAERELTIFAAASLTDAFKEMAAQIEQANPGTKLTFNLAG
jgi:ABC-type molybdate transport system substrate-binding protein